MSVIARLYAQLYTLMIFFSFLWRVWLPSSSLKSGFSTFYIEEKFDTGDWKELCGATGRHRLANNREITRRFCLFSGISLTSRCKLASARWTSRNEIKSRCLCIELPFVFERASSNHFFSLQSLFQHEICASFFCT